MRIGPIVRNAIDIEDGEGVYHVRLADLLPGLTLTPEGFQDDPYAFRTPPIGPKEGSGDEKVFGFDARHHEGAQRVWLHLHEGEEKTLRTAIEAAGGMWHADYVLFDPDVPITQSDPDEQPPAPQYLPRIKPPEEWEYYPRTHMEEGTAYTLPSQPINHQDFPLGAGQMREDTIDRIAEAIMARVEERLTARIVPVAEDRPLPPGLKED